MKPKSKSKSKPNKTPKPPNKSPPTESPAEEGGFSFAVARIAVSQICQSVGFKSAQASALETLTSVAENYIEALAMYSSTVAASANRTDSNLFDISAALCAFRSGPAVSAAAASSANRRLCALSSPDLAEIADFAGSVAETPFAKPVPRPRRQPDSIGGDSIPRALRPPHVRHWLPEFPDQTAATAVRSENRRGVEELWENSAGKRESCDVAMPVAGEKKLVVRGEGKLGLGNGRERVRFKLRLREHE